MVIDYQGRIGGKPFDGSDGTDINVIIGSKQSMPELEEGLQRRDRRREPHGERAAFPRSTRTRPSPARPRSCKSP